VTDLYKKAYELRTVHTKNLKQILYDHQEEVTSIILLSANTGLTYVDSAILLDAQRTQLRKISMEHTRFEAEMKALLGIKGDINEA
jgi:hypothetical protein